MHDLRVCNLFRDSRRENVRCFNRGFEAALYNSPGVVPLLSCEIITRLDTSGLDRPEGLLLTGAVSGF